MAYNILLMGASYGSLLASKLLFGGHSIHLVCLPAEADLDAARDRRPLESYFQEIGGTRTLKREEEVILEEKGD